MSKTKSAAPVEINNLSKAFGQKKVLDKVSISTKPGEIFGLIGLNGAGKTTMIKILLGLLEQDSGGVSIFGNNMDNAATRKNISYLPEKFQPSSFLKGKEFLDLTLSYYKKPLSLEKAKKFAKSLDLDPKVLEWKVSKYSKGMTQKLGLLSAMMTETPLLILDEPMSGLDPSARIHLKDNLLNYVKGGKSIFFSSHILSDIDEICKKIAVIHNQKILFAGTPAGFKKKYNSKILERAFLKAIEKS